MRIRPLISARGLGAGRNPTESTVTAAFADVNRRRREARVRQAVDPPVLRDVVVSYTEIVRDLFDNRRSFIIGDRVAYIRGVRVVRVGPNARSPVIVDIVIFDGD